MIAKSIHVTIIYMIDILYIYIYTFVYVKHSTFVCVKQFLSNDFRRKNYTFMIRCPMFSVGYFEI